MFGWLRALVFWRCAHADALCFEPDRVFLRCMHCGRETPGWAVAMSQRERR